MWRVALLAACVAVALAKDGLQLHVMPCPFAAIGGSDNKVTISWDKDAGECQYKIIDSSLNEVEANTAVGTVEIAIAAIGRYKVELVCDKGSEAMYFDTKFLQPPSQKQITATAFPWDSSAYISFSSSQSNVEFSCKLDEETPFICTSPWRPQALASGTHDLTLSLSVPQDGTVDLRAIETLTIPIQV